MLATQDRKTPVLRKRYLGAILIEHALITIHQLKHVLRIQETRHKPLGELLIDLGYVQELDIVTGLVVQCHIPYIAVDRYEINLDVIKLIPNEVARRYRVVPLDCINRILSVVMTDPLDEDVKMQLQNITNCRLVPFIATKTEIERAIRRWYN